MTTLPKIELTTLSKEELTKINGGHNGEAYEAGRIVGKIIKVALIAIPMGKWLRRIF